jgi:hypothetical protein
MLDAMSDSPETPSIDGNEAVARAAEQAKNTADRNIPSLGDLPVAEDTANLRQGPSLHDGLLALLPLIGVWRGEGNAAPTDGSDPYAFGQQLVFAHDGENYISYSSRIWRLDEEGNAVGPDRRETGFLRIDLEDNIEFVTAHSDGAVEIMYGKPLTERAWQLESASTMVTETGPSTLGPGKRLYGLMPNNNLGWVDERIARAEDGSGAEGGLTPWMSAELSRVMG